MPYASTKDLPPRLQKFSDTVKRQWMHVFNQVYESTGDEGRAFQAANSVLKKRFKGGASPEKNNARDSFAVLVEDWLGNIPG